jgi:hypothetical protein
MRIVATAICTLVVGATVAACGGKSSTSPHTTKATTPKATATATTPKATATATTPKATATTSSGSRNLGADAQRVIAQAAVAAGRLASGNAAAVRTAHKQLASVHADADRIAAEAGKLPISNPARTVISQTLHQVSLATAKLESMSTSESARARSTLLEVQRELRSLSKAVGSASHRLSAASASTIAKDLKSIALQLGIA